MPVFSLLMLKSRRQFPPGGFHFYESRTNWSPMAMQDFETTVDLIVAHRKANPRFASQWSTSWEAVANELDEQTCRHLQSKGLSEQWCVNPGSESFPNGPVRQSSWLGRKLADAAEGVKLVAGIGVLTDWLGSGGKPVSSSVSNFRASICRDCPQNQTGDWTRFFTNPASETIRKQLAIKHDLDLSTPHDEALGVCAACSCPLKLKVHTPLNHVHNHLKPDVRDRLDRKCWILHEQVS